jgi:hypothetical protein
MPEASRVLANGAQGWMVKNSQKLYRFFTDFFTARGGGGWIWSD